ncbi:hypothetical protein Tco_0516349, partial [Tanacetum coccineum]
GPYEYKQVLKPGEDTAIPPVPDIYRPQNDTELSDDERKQVEADDQAIHILLFGLPVDEKSIILLDELEKFTSTEGETIGSYFERLFVLINDLDMKKFTPKIIHTNLKWLNHFQRQWTHFITRVKQTMDLYTVDYNKIYDYLKQIQFEANGIRATRMSKSHDPLALYSKTPATAPYALMANTPQQTYPSLAYTPQQSLPLNNIIVQQPIPNNNNNVRSTNISF